MLIGIRDIPHDNSAVGARRRPRNAACDTSDYGEGVDERPWAAGLGLPAMIALLAFIAAAKAVSGVGGLLIAVVAVLVVCLVIGFALSQTDKR